MTADPYTWPDPGDLHAQLCAARAENARLRAQLATITAERDALVVEQERMTTALCSAAVHDGRGGRIGERLFWRGVIGA